MKKAANALWGGVGALFVVFLLSPLALVVLFYLITLVKLGTES